MAPAERSSSKNASNGEIAHQYSATIEDTDDAVTVDVEAPGTAPQPVRKWLQEAGAREGRPLLGRTAPSKRRWQRLCASFAGWIKRPANAVFFLWLVALVAGILLILLLMLLPESSRREDWIEAGNQVVNALLTVMCLYQHPKLTHHLLLLLRWTPQDAADLRAKYCEYAAARPRERLHLSAVIGLLHLTCIAQYVYCAFCLAYSRTTRPDDALTVVIAVGVASPTVAGLYTSYGPLGRTVASAGIPPERSDPEGAADGQQIGGLFDCLDDLTSDSDSNEGAWGALEEGSKIDRGQVTA